MNLRRPLILAAGLIALWQLLVALTGTILGFVLGLLVAIVRTLPLPKGGPLRKLPLRLVQILLNVYIEVFRGTPMIVQSMVIYYGSMMIGLIKRGSPVLPAAIFIVSINTGAYMAEIIRGGIISVDVGQKEAATAIGMTHWQSMVKVVLPQAVRNIMPSIGNEFVVNIKDSSVLNVISLNELYFTGKGAAGTYGRYFEAFFIIACIYLTLTFTVTFTAPRATATAASPSAKKRGREHGRHSGSEPPDQALRRPYRAPGHQFPGGYRGCDLHHRILRLGKKHPAALHQFSGRAHRRTNPLSREKRRYGMETHPV
jgi:putative lysine transport system permease protein